MARVEKQNVVVVKQCPRDGAYMPFTVTDAGNIHKCLMCGWVERSAQGRIIEIQPSLDLEGEK